MRSKEKKHRLSSVWKKWKISWNDFSENYRLHHLARYFFYLLILWFVGTNTLYFAEWLALHNHQEIYKGSVFFNYFQSYWNIVVYLLSGIEDKEPITAIAKVGAFVILLSSLVMVGIFTGTLTSIIIERVKSRYFIKHKPSSLKFNDHIIICGQNRELKKIIHELFFHTKGKNKILLINEKANQIEKDEKDIYSLVWGISGIPHYPGILQQADIDTAKSVIILADGMKTNLTHSEQIDIDSKTLLVAMAVRKANPDIYICTEILERNNQKLFYREGVNEVIYVRDFFDKLVTQSINIKGIGKLYRLLSKSGVNFGSIYKCDLPENIQEEGLTYNDARKKIIRFTDGLQLVGIEQNSQDKKHSTVTINPKKMVSGDGITSSYILRNTDKLIILGNQKPDLDDVFK